MNNAALTTILVGTALHTIAYGASGTLNKYRETDLGRNPVSIYEQTVTTSPIVFFTSDTILSHAKYNENSLNDLDDLFNEVDMLGNSVKVMSYGEWREFRADEDEWLNKLHGLED